MPGVDPERAAQLAAAGGDLEGADEIEPHKGVDPDDPSPGVLACGHDPDNDPCKILEALAGVGEFRRPGAPRLRDRVQR